MKTTRIKLALSFTNFLFALLLSSVGVVILQMINKAGIAPEEASILEAFKDIPLAIASFSLATLVPRWGYKNTMLTALFLVVVSTTMMALTGEFVHAKLFFLLSGVGFGLFKLAGYPSISLVAKNSTEHASFMSFLEAMFMVGVLSGFWIFGTFIGFSNRFHAIVWTDVYWILAGLSLLGFFFLWTTPFEEESLTRDVVHSETTSLNGSPSPESTSFGQRFVQDFLEILQLVRLPLVLFFCLGIFAYVYAEQALNSWLPAFNNKVLNLPEALSVQLGMIYGGTLAIGRLLGGWVIKKIHWFYVLECCLVLALGGLLITLSFVSTDSNGTALYQDTIPLSAWILPLVGFFFAPLYPTLSSTVLTSVPSSKQSGMTGLIVLFSALGGTTGSMITGTLFGHLGGLTALYYLLIPILLLILALIPYRILVEKSRG